MTIWDHASRKSFLVDSGADESVFPATAQDQTLPRSQPLVAANGTEIATFGRRQMTLSLALGHSISQSFWIANVKRPILGADFFISHHLLIDLPKRRLLDASTARPFQGRPAHAPAAAISGLHRAHTGPYEALLQEFPDLLVQKFGSKVKHNIRHHIPTRGPPLHARARRLEGDKLASAKAELRNMEDLGIIRRSDSPWASPLHVVPKSDGSWRTCGDYRRLNAITEDDRYPLPHIQDFNGNLRGKTIFSVVDLVRGFHQIPMAPGDVPKTCLLYTSPSPRD